MESLHRTATARIIGIKMIPARLLLLNAVVVALTPSQGILRFRYALWIEASVNRYLIGASPIVGVQVAPGVCHDPSEGGGTAVISSAMA